MSEARKRPSLRGVLLAATAGVAVTGVVLTAVLTLGLTRLGSLQRAVDQVGREADRLSALAAGIPCTGRLDPREVERELGPGAVFIPAGVRPPLGFEVGSQGSATVGDRELLYAVRETSICELEGTLYLLRASAEVTLVPEGFVLRMVVAGFMAVAGAAGVSWLLARRMSRPLGELAASARAIAGGRSPDMPSTEPSDPIEVAEVKEAFAGMAVDLRGAREREKSFLLSVSHELRTPLTAIQGYGEALADGTARHTGKAGQVIMRESKRLDRLVRDLIDLARLEAGEFSVHRAEVDVAEVARSVVEALAPAASEAGVGLEVRAGPMTAVTDADRLHQMLANLVENAMRVTPAGGSVVIEVGAGVVAVQDSGPGIAADDLERIFERFYLWRRYQGERPVGTGLGLAIVGELARLLGIRVDVRSQEGARFELHLDAETRSEAGDEVRLDA